MSAIQQFPHEKGKEVTIKVGARKSLDDQKWEIRISGLPDFEIISVDVDDLTIIARLDASRFKPRIETLRA